MDKKKIAGIVGVILILAAGSLLKIDGLKEEICGGAPVAAEVAQ